MIVNLRSISAAGKTLEGEEDASVIDIEDPCAEFHSPVRYRVTVSKAGNMLLVRGELRSLVHFTCACCLKQFDSEVVVKNFRVHREITEPDGIMNLTDAVREDMILALPAKVLCREDCRGVCPRCGQDRNVGSCDCSLDREESPFARLGNLKLKGQQPLIKVRYRHGRSKKKNQ